MVNAALQGTATPELQHYVENYADQQAAQGVQDLSTQYSTILPTIVTSAMNKALDNTQMPQWAHDAVAKDQACVTAEVNKLISLATIKQSCSSAPSTAAACTTDNTQSSALSCDKGTNTCTLTLFGEDTILYIPNNNLVVDGDLTVNQQLTATNITASGTLGTSGQESSCS
jgi:hypothetical protein